MDDPCLGCEDINRRDVFLSEQQNLSSILTHLHTAKELAISLDRIKRLCEATFEGIVIHENSTYIDSNQQFAEMFGYTQEELKGIDGFLLFDPESRQLAREKMASSYEGTYQAVGLRKDGTTFPIELRAKNSHLDGRMVRIVACRDLSKERQSQDQLLLRHRLLEAIIESSSDCIVVLDKDLKHLYANQSVCDYLKTTRENFVGKDLSEVLGPFPEYLSVWKSRLEDLFKTGKRMHFSDAMTLGDRYVYSESILSPIYRPTGEIFAVSLVYRDITERKKAAIELQVSEERLKRLSETSFEGIIIHHRGKILDANQKAIDLLGYTLEELRRTEGNCLFAPESREIAERHAASGYQGTYEAKCLKKDGTIFPVEIQTRESQIEGATVRISAIKDMTHQKSIEHQLIEGEKKYRELYDRAWIPLYRTQISDGKLLECNQALAQMYGYSSPRECLENHYSVSHYVNPAQREELLKRLKEEGTISNFEIEFKRLNGSTGWLEASATIYPDQGYIEGAQFDVTASRVLSPAEKNVVKMMLHGLSNKQIAQKLERSVRTIEDHRANIMHKLGIDNLVELGRIAQILMFE